MRYYVTIDPRAGSPPIAVDLVELPDGSIQARVGGRAVEVDVAPIGPMGPEICVRVDAHVVDLTTDRTGPNLAVMASGRRAEACVETERSRAAAPTGGALRSTHPRRTLVRSPMPGRVIRVLVAPGDRVEAGVGLVILEAMKMENEVRSHLGGVVVEVHVTEGAAVEANAKLVTIG
ncbi:MAG: biotin/lipoyl-containing protein [Polyangiaceae bacterium]